MLPAALICQSACILRAFAIDTNVPRGKHCWNELIVLGFSAFPTSVM